LAISKQQIERSLLKWNLILADRDDIIASLKVRHFKEISGEVDHQLTAGKRTSFPQSEMTSSLHSRLVTSECTCRGWPSAYSRKRGAF
jgi:hypothetical protein